MEEQNQLVIGNHVREQQGNEPCKIANNFRVVRKCSSKFDCLIFETFLLRTLKIKRKPLKLEQLILVETSSNSIRSTSVILRLYPLLIQSSFKAFLARIPIVSSTCTGTLVNSAEAAFA